MKKLIYSLILGVCCAVFLFMPNVKAASEIDQQFTASTGSFTLWGGTDANYQVFRPAKNTLDKVAVDVFNFDAGNKIEFKIKKWNGSGWDLVKASNPQLSIEGWNEFSFAGVSVTPESRYAIFVNVFTDGSPRWKYSSNGTYGRGYVIAQGTEQPYWDANFKTWGYDAAAAPSGGTTNSNSQTTTGTSGVANSNKKSTANSNSTPTNSSATNQNQTDTNPFPIIYSVGGLEFTPFIFYGLGAIAILSIILAYMIYHRKKMEKNKKHSKN